ncbi:hypothetical protein ABZ835_11690 [Streptomyces sp. NPDC047461]|uniref:hypothetical protein n=1 Tax=Streptomyces sp. NPDC047461 TaxID=3155619 RepID=UPI0033C59082
MTSPRRVVRLAECAADSRGAEVMLTAEGAEAFKRASLPQPRAVRELFVSPLTRDQPAAAEQLATTLRTGLESPRGA